MSVRNISLRKSGRLIIDSPGERVVISSNPEVSTGFLASGSISLYLEKTDVGRESLVLTGFDADLVSSLSPIRCTGAFVFSIRFGEAASTAAVGTVSESCSDVPVIPLEARAGRHQAPASSSEATPAHLEKACVRFDVTSSPMWSSAWCYSGV